MTEPNPHPRDGAEGNSPPPSVRDRRGFLGVAAMLVGLALVVGAVMVWQGSAGAPDSGTDFVLDAIPERLSVDGVSAGPELPAPAPTPTAAAPAVPVASGLLGEVQEAAPPVPVRLSIPSLDVSAEVRAVGYEGTAMEVPRDAESIGWWRHGASPGQDGSAVLAGHVTWHGERGPFYAIGDLAPGSEIEVEFSDGTTATFQAVARSSYAKPDLPTARLFAQNTPPILHLITCGGDYDGRSRSYEDNIVVTAVIADGSDAVSGARQ